MNKIKWDEVSDIVKYPIFNCQIVAFDSNLIYLYNSNLTMNIVIVQLYRILLSQDLFYFNEQSLVIGLKNSIIRVK